MAGIVPFGLIYGAAAQEAGLSLIESQGMSLTIFAGLSQMVLLDLWQSGAALIIIVLTVLTVNLRLLVYSASISPYLNLKSRSQSLLAAYFLVDEGYGVFMGQMLSGHKKPPVPLYFHVGASFPTYFSWQVCSLLGYLLGTFIPPSWPLHMAIPFIFLSLLLPLLAKGPKLVSAFTAMVVAVLAARAPFNLGLLLAVFSGVAAGVLYSKLRGEK